ncbi:hypothetical protein J3F84DRAFT_376759 [Trichoderma pleuroticola]
MPPNTPLRVGVAAMLKLLAPVNALFLCLPIHAEFSLFHTHQQSTDRILSIFYRSRSAFSPLPLHQRSYMRCSIRLESANP